MSACKDTGDKFTNYHAWGDYMGHKSWMEALGNDPGVLLSTVKVYLLAAWYLIKAVLGEIYDTRSSTKIFMFTKDRVGLTPSAILLGLLVAICMGPVEQNAAAVARRICAALLSLAWGRLCIDVGQAGCAGEI